MSDKQQALYLNLEQASVIASLCEKYLGMETKRPEAGAFWIDKNKNLDYELFLFIPPDRIIRANNGSGVCYYYPCEHIYDIPTYTSQDLFDWLPEWVKEWICKILRTEDPKYDKWDNENDKFAILNYFQNNILSNHFPDWLQIWYEMLVYCAEQGMYEKEVGK